MAVRQCFEAGADMVKTQMIWWESAWWATKKQRQRYKKLNDKWCDGLWGQFFFDVNVRHFQPVFASIFDEKYLDMNLVNKFNPAWKLGYKTKDMPGLTDKVIDSGKPIIVSIGTDHTLPRFGEKDWFWQFHSKAGGRSILLWCQPEYPISHYSYRLPAFSDMSFKGLSVHTDNINSIVAAVPLGAQLIEVHVQCENAEGPDTNFALTLNELSKLVKLKDRLWHECHDAH